MYVRRDVRHNPVRYKLCEYSEESGKRKREEICDYGKQEPTFITPDLRNGLCENELEALTV